MPRRASLANVALDLFPTDLIAPARATAAASTYQAVHQLPWIGQVFGTGIDSASGHRHLLLAAGAICGEQIDAIPMERGVIARNIDCPICLPVLNAWPYWPWAPT